jgi:soluble epoxide hydrolase/lipid-phosphate phosphatase
LQRTIFFSFNLIPIEPYCEFVVNINIMDHFIPKTFTTNRNLTYTYYHREGSADTATLLLQHGFPDDHDVWAKVLPYLLGLPFGIIIPDLLGYNGTSKPADASLYNSKDMANDIAEILDHEKIPNIVSVGHDWGSFMAQRMWLWHPDRVVGLILLNVAYSPPTQFDLDKVNQAMEKITGLPRLAYWQILTAPDGVQLLRDNMESFWAAMHGSQEDLFEQLFCHYGAIEDFIRKDKRAPLKSFAEDPALKDTWFARYKRDGFQGPVNWYLAQTQGHHWAVEKQLPKKRLIVTVPVLFIGASEDSACMTDAIYAPQKAGMLPDLTIKEVKSGHWQTMEAPDQTGPLLVAWLKERETKLGKSRL